MKKVLIVNERFMANKIKERYGRMRYFTNRIYAVVAESEKAYRVVCASDATGYYEFWTPKSLVSTEVMQEWEDGEEINPNVVVNENESITDIANKIRMTSEKAWESYSDMMALYR